MDSSVDNITACILRKYLTITEHFHCSLTVKRKCSMHLKIVGPIFRVRVPFSGKKGKRRFRVGKFLKKAQAALGNEASF